MPAGFNMFDASGHLLIDAERLYYGLVWSGYAEPAPNGFWAGLDDDPLHKVEVLNCKFPVLYISGEGTLVSIIRNGNLTTFEIYGYAPIPSDDYYIWNIYPPGITHPSNPAPKCYVFDLMRANKEHFGIEILSQDGTPVFNSNMPPLNAAASVMPPPVAGISSRPYTKIGYDQWSFDTSPSSQYAFTCSISMASLGLSTSREYAYHMPWSRGAQAYGQGDDYNVWESVATGNGRVGFYWQFDVFTPQVLNPGGGEVIYGVHPNRVAASLIDVTDLPFPFSY